MSQPAQMNMPVMGGPVGGIAAGAQMNPASPSNQSVDMSPQTILIKLNTAIYDYMLRAQIYDVAKSFQEKFPIDVRPKEEVKQSNGVDDVLDDNRDQGIIKRPDGLPLPRNLFDGPVLQDWWCQFWELYHGQRGRGKNGTMQYLQGQRTMQKARTNLMGANMDPTLQAMRPGYTMVPGMNNGMAMGPGDLRKTAMQGNTQQRNLTPQQMNQLKLQNAQSNAQMMQGNAMERQGSQMDGSAPRSGSPGSGDGPSSPKRQRIEGNLQQMAQGRPGQAVPMQGTPSVELYSQSVTQSMQAALQGVNNNSSNVNKGMNPNLGPGGAQGSPMNQAGMDAANPDFYAGVNGNRMAMQQNTMQQNAAASAAAANQAGNGGNHALQDYQMQLMLLEQQNKKRLLMARQEQDMVAHPGGAANGAFPPGMSPQGSRQGGDPSPNPNEMRAAMMDPNQIPPAMRAQMTMNNGQMLRPPPSSHPGMAATMTPQQIEAMRQQQGLQLTNGQFAGGQPGQAQMMPGQPGAQAGQPGQVQPLGTPRQANTNMPPPPAPPANAAGGQPSSPSQQQPPPTPNQNPKSKPATKKEPANKKGAANKKGGNAGATPATESEQPPTPTPATPATPMTQNQFAHNKNQQLANGQPAGAPGNVMGNNGQPGQAAQAPNAGQQPAPQPSADLNFNMMTDEQFGNLDLAFDNTDLDNFDFDSFLNQDGNEFPFDVNDAFGGDPLGMDPS